MRKWTGAWLAGPDDNEAGWDPDRPNWRGEGLGLPQTGPGSVAAPGRRAGGFLLDIVLAGLVTTLFTQPWLPHNQDWTIVTWLVITVLPVAVFGFTPGMAATRIRVARLDGASLVGVPRALLRAALTFVILPALVWNFDGRAWHDRASGTVVVLR